MAVSPTRDYHSNHNSIFSTVFFSFRFCHRKHWNKRLRFCGFLLFTFRNSTALINSFNRNLFSFSENSTAFLSPIDIILESGNATRSDRIWCPPTSSSNSPRSSRRLRRGRGKQASASRRTDLLVRQSSSFPSSFSKSFLPERRPYVVIAQRDDRLNWRPKLLCMVISSSDVKNDHSTITTVFPRCALIIEAICSHLTKQTVPNTIVRIFTTTVAVDW